MLANALGRDNKSPYPRRESAAQQRLPGDVARILSSFGERRNVLGEALGVSARGLGARAAWLLLHEPPGEGAPATGAWVHDDAALGAEALIDAVRAAALDAVGEGGAVLLGAPGHAAVPEPLASRGIATLAIVPAMAGSADAGYGADRQGGSEEPPLVRRPAVVGTLVLAGGPGARWDVHPSGTLGRVADIFGRRLEADALLHAQARRISELSALARVAENVQRWEGGDGMYAGFALALYSLVDYRHLCVALLDQEDRLVPVLRFAPGGRTLPPRAPKDIDRAHRWLSLRHHERWSEGDGPTPSFVPDGARHAIAIPVRPKGSILGVVVLVTARAVTEEQGELLAQAVNQLGAAIDSASLYRQATERAARLQVYGNLAAIVASVLDLREAFDAFAEEVRWLIPFDRAGMLLVDEQKGTVHPYATYPASPEGAQSAFPLAQSPASVAIEAGGAVAVYRSNARHAALDWETFGPDVQVMAAVPVSSEQGVGAIFVLLHTDARKYTEEEFAALDEVAGLLGVTMDRLRLYEETQHHARHDSLTGLPNLRYVRERLGALRAGVGDAGESAVLVIDLDDLKAFNDTLGHESGDRVLCAVARDLRAACRAEDLVARTGGDEFAIVMEHADEEAATAVAGRVHALLADAGTEPGGVQTRIRVSIGIAVAPGDAGNAEGLLRAADQAMYQAKFAGGSRTRLASAGDAEVTPQPGGMLADRVVPALVHAITVGATAGERAVLALAQRCARGTALALDIPAEAVPLLRLLVASQVSSRQAARRESRDGGGARLLLDGLRLAWAERDARAAADCEEAALAAAELAWLMSEPPVGSALPFAEAMRRLRAEPPEGVSERVLDRLESATRSLPAERRRGGLAA